MHELQSRTIEFTRVLNVFKGDEFATALTEIADSCEKRHKKAISATRPLPYVQKQALKGSVEKKNEFFTGKGITDSRIIRNNSEWLESLTSLANNPLSLNNGNGGSSNLVGSEHFESRINLYTKEMEERSNDLTELKQLFLKFKQINVDGVSNIGMTSDELKTNCNNYLHGIKERHVECDKDLKSMLLDSDNYDNIVNHESENENKQIVATMNDNNRDWRAEVGKFLAQITMLGKNTLGPNFLRRTSTGSVFFGSVSPRVGASQSVSSPKQQGGQQSQGLEVIHDTESKTEETNELSIAPAIVNTLNISSDMWWLDRNTQRAEFIDEIIVDASVEFVWFFLIY